MRRAILVNGVPASGKSTVSASLSRSLGLPVLALDTVKEALFDELGDGGGDREFGRALGRASIGAIWGLVGAFPPDAVVIVDAWLRLPPHDALLAGLQRAGIGAWAEIWCHADPALIMARYAGRVRHPGHPPPEAYADELGRLAGIARPTGLAPCLEFDTADLGPEPLAAVAAWVRGWLARPGTVITGG